MKKCSAPDCNAKIGGARTFCTLHVREVDEAEAGSGAAPGQICKKAGCAAVVEPAKGYCERHYEEKLGEQCSVEECSRRSAFNGLCRYHYEQDERFQRVVAQPPAVVHPEHYAGGAFETWDYIEAHGLGFLEGNVIKYTTRFRRKEGITDLLKARQYLDKLIEIEQKKAVR